MYNVHYASCSPAPLSSCCAVNDHLRSCQALVVVTTYYGAPSVQCKQEMENQIGSAHIYQGRDLASYCTKTMGLVVENPAGYFLLQIADVL